MELPSRLALSTLCLRCLQVLFAAHTRTPTLLVDQQHGLTHSALGTVLCPTLHCQGEHFVHQPASSSYSIVFSDWGTSEIKTQPTDPHMQQNHICTHCTTTASAPPPKPPKAKRPVGQIGLLERGRQVKAQLCCMHTYIYTAGMHAGMHAVYIYTYGRNPPCLLQESHSVLMY